MKIQIEARLISELGMTQVVPAALKYQNKLMDNAKGLAEFGLDNSHVKSVLEKVNKHVGIIQSQILAMNVERGDVNLIEETQDKAQAYCDRIKTKYFDKIRESVDKLEVTLDDEDWPLLKYREMLFLR